MLRTCLRFVIFFILSLVVINFLGRLFLPERLDFTNYYDLLGVGPKASDEEITRAWMKFDAKTKGCTVPGTVVCEKRRLALAGYHTLIDRYRRCVYELELGIADGLFPDVDSVALCDYKKPQHWASPQK